MNRSLRTALGAIAIGITESQKKERNKKIFETIEKAYTKINIGMSKTSIERLLGNGNIVKITNKYYITRYLDTFTESTSTAIYMTGTMGVKTGRIKCYIEVKYDMNDIAIEIIKKGLNGIQVLNETNLSETKNNNGNTLLDKLVKRVGDFDDEKYLDITGRDVLFYQIGYLCCLDKNPNEWLIRNRFFHYIDDEIENSDIKDESNILKQESENDNVSSEEEEEKYIEEYENNYNRLLFIVLQLISENVIRIKDNTVFTPSGIELLAFEPIITYQEFVTKYKLENSNINYHDIILDYNTDNEYEKEIILTEKYNYDLNYDRRIHCGKNNRDKKFYEVGMLLLSQNREVFNLGEIRVLVNNRLEIDDIARIRHILRQLEEAFVLKTNYDKVDGSDSILNSITYSVLMNMSEYASKYSNGANKVYYKTRRELYDNDSNNDIEHESGFDTNYLNGKNKILVAVSCFFLGLWGAHNFIMGETKKGLFKIILLLPIYIISAGLSINDSSPLYIFVSLFSFFLVAVWIRDLVKIIKGTYEVDSTKWL